MGTPEEKARKRQRMKSHITKDLRTPKYRQKIKEAKKRIEDLSHAEFVELIQECTDE